MGQNSSSAHNFKLGKIISLLFVKRKIFPSMAMTHSADPDQTASSEAV